MFCNRGIYHEGWTAVTRHGIPWVLVGGEKPAFDDDVWELYDTSTDWTQCRRPRRRSSPEKLAELQQLFLIEATKYNVLPLDDRVAERLNPDIAGRPRLVQGDRQLLFGGMGRLTESSIVNIKNKSHAVTAEIVVPEGGAQGVIIAQGGSIGGWSLYLKDGKPAVLLQPARHPALLCRRREEGARGHAPGPDGIHLRRAGAGEGR